MADGGFSFFFVLVGLGGLAVLGWTVLSNLLHIQAALRGELAQRPAPNYKVTLYRPMDHPDVAKRMRGRRQQEWARTSPARQAQRVRALRR